MAGKRGALGMAIASWHLLFAPLFATLCLNPTRHGTLGYRYLTFYTRGGAVVIWWLVALTGAAVGWVQKPLSFVRRRRESPRLIFNSFCHSDGIGETPRSAIVDGYTQVHLSPTISSTSSTTLRRTLILIQTPGQARPSVVL